MIELLIWSVAIAVISFVVGWKSHVLVIAWYIKRLHDSNNDTVERTMVSITQVGEMYLLHDITTGEFLAQGRNHQEVVGMLCAKFPSKVNFVATEKNIQEVGYKTE